MSALWQPLIAQGPAVPLPGDTIPALFWAGVQARGARTYLREKKLGIWRSWTWQQCGEVVCEMAQGLRFAAQAGDVVFQRGLEVPIPRAADEEGAVVVLVEPELAGATDGTGDAAAVAGAADGADAVGVGGG